MGCNPEVYYNNDTNYQEVWQLAVSRLEWRRGSVRNAQARTANSIMSNIESREGRYAIQYINVHQDRHPQITSKDRGPSKIRLELAREVHSLVFQERQFRGGFGCILQKDNIHDSNRDNVYSNQWAVIPLRPLRPAEYLRSVRTNVKDIRGRKPLHDSGDGAVNSVSRETDGGMDQGHGTVLCVSSSFSSRFTPQGAGSCGDGNRINGIELLRCRSFTKTGMCGTHPKLAQEKSLMARVQVSSL
jgi:hypothetical protein